MNSRVRAVVAGATGYSGRDLIKLLTGPTAIPAIKSKGMEPG